MASHDINSGLNLYDHILLDRRKISLFHQFGIHNLENIIDLSDEEFDEILGMERYYYRYIRKIAHILSQGRIPIRCNETQLHLIWIGQTDQPNKVNLIVSNPNNKFQLFNNLNVKDLEEIIKHPQILIINKILAPGYYKESWDAFLQMNLLMGFTTNHEQLLRKYNYRDINCPHGLIDEDESIPHSVYLRFHEIKFLIHKFYYLKQFLRSSIIDSSVKRTANKPPKL